MTSLVYLRTSWIKMIVPNKEINLIFLLKYIALNWGIHYVSQDSEGARDFMEGCKNIYVIYYYHNKATGLRYTVIPLI